MGSIAVSLGSTEGLDEQAADRKENTGVRPTVYQTLGVRVSARPLPVASLLVC